MEYYRPDAARTTLGNLHEARPSFTTPESESQVATGSLLSEGGAGGGQGVERWEAGR
jgi:hypothetical protein